MAQIKPISGYSGYYISSNGEVLSTKGKEVRFLKSCGQHYKHVVLFQNGEPSNHNVHRLVALHFIANDAPDIKTEVAHNDCNPFNNNVENLSWVSHIENVNNPITIERRRKVFASEETRKRMSESQKRRFQNKRNKPPPTN